MLHQCYLIPTTKLSSVTNKTTHRRNGSVKSENALTTECIATNLVCFSEDSDVCRQLHPYQVQLMGL